MSDILKPADTPKEQPAANAEVKGTTPPAAPKDTPADKSQQGDNVTLTKEEHNLLKKQAAIASSAQKKADRLERLVNRKTREGVFTGKPAPEPITPPTTDELKVQGEEEDRKAEMGVMRLSTDPKYRKILDSDETLREMMTKTPINMLRMYANNPVDAEEAIDMVTEHLDSRLEAMNIDPATTDPKPAANTDEPAIPPAGGVNVAAAQTDEVMEGFKKMSNVEDAVSKMVKHKMNFGRK